MDAEPSDVELMQRTAAGDEPAFRALVERWRDSVARFLYLCTGNAHDAEELAQDVFVRVYRAAGSYTPTAKFNTWLFTIARNLCRNWHRKPTALSVPLDEAAHAESVPASDESPRDALMRKEQDRLVAAALNQLPERQRAALTLRVYESMSYSDIAEVLGASCPAVETLIFRAREAMRARVAPELRKK